MKHLLLTSALLLNLFYCAAQDVTIDKKMHRPPSWIYVRNFNKPYEGKMGDIGIDKCKVSLKDSNILIENNDNPGLGGESVTILISRDLKILTINYRQWSDVIDGSKTEYKVEKP